MKMFLSHLESPLGALMLVTDAQQTVCALDFSDHRARLRRSLHESYGPIELEEIATPIEIAQALGLEDPRAAIDVGAANGANPIAIIVPCHRVIASNGDLKGYAWGLDRKRWLLEHEGAMAPKPDQPQTAALAGF